MSLVGAARNSGRSVWASAGNPSGVERDLGRMVEAMGGSAPSARVPAARGGLIAQESLSGQDLSGLAGWVIDSGDPYVIPSAMAQNLGLPSVDLPIRQIVYRTNDQKLHIVMVSTQNAHVDLFFAHVVISEDTFIGTVWRTDETGQLLATIYKSGDGYTPIPANDHRYDQEFEAEKKYFLSMVPASSAGS